MIRTSLGFDKHFEHVSKFQVDCNVKLPGATVFTKSQMTLQYATRRFVTLNVATTLKILTTHLQNYNNHWRGDFKLKNSK